MATGKIVSKNIHAERLKLGFARKKWNNATITEQLILEEHEIPTVIAQDIEDVMIASPPGDEEGETFEVEKLIKEMCISPDCKDPTVCRKKEIQSRCKDKC